jgi:hypothetical protein
VKRKIQLLAFLLVLFTLVLANMPLVRADQGTVLPPRPPTITPRPVERLIGAHIVLRLREEESPLDALWTVVQWQADNKEYYDVAGWRGRFDGERKVRWWVEQKDFSTGPFLWQIYDSEGGKLLASSDPFFLPARENEIMTIYIDLGTAKPD